MKLTINHTGGRRVVTVIIVSLLVFSLAGTAQLGPASADQVVSKISVGGNPGKIAVNPNTDRIYVTDHFSNGVTVIDGSTNSVAGTIPGLSNILTVNPDANKIYSAVTWQNSSEFISGCCFYGGCDVKIFDVASNTIESDIPVSQGTTYCHGAIAANPKTNMIYAGLIRLQEMPGGGGVNDYGYIAIVNATSESFVGNMSLPDSPQSMVMNPETNKLYISYWGSCSCVTVFDANKGTSSTISLGGANGYDLAVDTSADKIYAAPGVTGSGIIVIDGSTDTVTGMLGPLAQPFYVGVDQSSNRIFTETESNLASVDGSTGKVWETRYDDGGSGAVAANVATHTAYFSDETTGNVVVLNEDLDAMPVLAYPFDASSAPYQATIPNFHIGTGNNQLLLVGISANNNSAVSVTFGGTPLKQAVSSFYNNDAEFWYLTNPSTTGDIVVTMSGGTQAVVGAYSISGVDQSNPIASVSKKYALTSSNPSISIDAKYAGDRVFDLPSIYGHSVLTSPTCMPEWEFQSSSQITGASSMANVTAPGTITCGWSSGNPDVWDDVAVEVKSSNSTSGSSSGSNSTVTTPSSPIGLNATAVSYSEINLSWNAPSSDGGSKITGYKIERSANGGSSWGTIVASTGSNDTAFYDTGLGAGKTYEYRVYAINTVGTSQPSNIATATTLATEPSSPTGLAATAVSSSEIDLTWNAPGWNGGAPVTGYEVQRSADSGSTWSIIVKDTGSTSTSYSDTGLSAGTTYSYRVMAINSAGTSNPSNVASATTPLISVAGVSVGAPALP